MTSEIWIIYQTLGDAHGWENRQLMPDGDLTDILAEELNFSRELPEVGDRIRDYANLADPGNGVTHSRDGDWQVAGVQQFSSFDTQNRIVVCHCEYAPINAQWEALQRGALIGAVTA